MLRIGQTVPDLVFVRTDGTPVPLSSFHGDAMVLVFMRHLGWIACNEHLVEVAEELSQVPGRVVGVAFAPPASVALFASGMNLAAPIVCDPEREAYRAFGFGRRGGWSALVHPVYWWRLLRALRRGRRLRLPREDPHQLGGDAVLDAELRLRWIHRSRYPADRPPVRRVLHEVRKAAALSALG